MLDTAHGFRVKASAIRSYQDKSTEECYSQISFLNKSDKDMLDPDFALVGELYSSLTLDKIEASSYLDKINQSAAIKKSVINKLILLTSKIPSLCNNELADIDFKIAHQKSEKVIERLKAQKEKLEGLAIQLNNDISALIKGGTVDNKDKIQHSTDFLRVCLDPQTGLFFEKQINNGTCTLHRNNAIIANLKNNTELEMTPWRIESLINAETILLAQDRLSALLDKINDNKKTTLKELVAAISEIKNSPKVAHPGNTNRLANGYIMDYINTSQIDRKIGSNRLNAASIELLTDHGFEPGEILACDDIICHRGTEFEQANIKKLYNHDALLISISGKTEGSDRSHAVSIIKKDNQHYFLDPHNPPVKIRLEQLFTLFSSQNGSEVPQELTEIYNHYSPYDCMTVRFAVNSSH